MLCTQKLQPRAHIHVSSLRTILLNEKVIGLKAVLGLLRIKVMYPTLLVTLHNKNNSIYYVLYYLPLHPVKLDFFLLSPTSAPLKSQVKSYSQQDKYKLGKKIWQQIFLQVMLILWKQGVRLQTTHSFFSCSPQFEFVSMWSTSVVTWEKKVIIIMVIWKGIGNVCEFYALSIQRCLLPLIRNSRPVKAFTMFDLLSVIVVITWIESL